MNCENVYMSGGKLNAIATLYRHINSSKDIITTYEATRAGFVALALEKNRRVTPYVAEARALQEAASQARNPKDLLNIKTFKLVY